MMNDRIHMLLVEDEQTLADIIADTLGEKEFDVTVAYNGVEGLRRFDEVHPDVVVTDIMMPGMDGFSFVDALRRRSADVPILFLSARSAVDDVVHGFETGGNDYLRKPFAMSELVVRVRALVGRNRVARQRPAHIIGSVVSSSMSPGSGSTTASRDRNSRRAKPAFCNYSANIRTRSSRHS